MSGAAPLAAPPARPHDPSEALAAVLVAPGRFELRPVPRREPGPGEVEVRLEGSGVCGSNLPVWEGRPWFEYPLPAGAPGHEGWGVVERVGAGVSAPAVGERVALLSGGAFATHDVAPAGSVVRLPDDPALAAFPGEAVGCAINVFRRSGVEPGQTVAVVGVGFLGALVAQLAAQSGARVIGLSRRPFAREVALGAGAEHVVATGDPAAALGEVAALTGGMLCDVVVEAAGVQDTLDLASALVKERGRLVIAGYHQDGPRRVDMQQWNWRGIDVINAHERDPAVYVRGIREAAEAVRGGRIDLAPLLTHTLPLADIGQALELARTRPDGFLKAVVTV